jgi:hypothetical protein
MSKQKLRIHNTQLDNLISNLRGEVGEVITSWVLLRHMMSKERELSSDDIAKDMRNESLIFVSMLRTKLADEIVARLSELAEAKIGQLTFYFASQKLKALAAEVEAFSDFIVREKLQQKRNLDISHKNLPEQWTDHGPIVIPYRTLLEAVGRAIRLMKRIDGIVVGPAAKYLWREMRKKRYQLMAPASAMYMMLPYMNLSPEIRQRVIMEEMATGRQVWSEMSSTINGQETKVSVCREWGALLLPGRMIVLDHYPLQQLNSIDVPPVDPVTAAAMAQAQPVTEECQITAKYRVTRKDEDSRISFAPVQRVHRLDSGSVTELLDIDINLNDKLGQDFADMEVGDEKEFFMTVTVLTGYRLPGQAPRDTTVRM